MRKLEEELKEVEHHLNNLIDYSIAYYQNILTKYGKGKERKTEIREFDTIAANIVAANNAKLYINRAEGFIGYGLKKDEFICDCSDMDDIIVFRRDGKFQVSRIQEKVFVGKDIIWAGVFNKTDDRMVYNMTYLDGESGRTMVKRFQVLGITRDKEYDLTKGTKNSKTTYFTANANGEAEVITVNLTAGAKARVKVFEFDFASLEIKGRGAGGNILTRYPVRKITLKSEGASTLGGLDIWYDDVTGRLNKDNRGKHIGNFQGDDLILVVDKKGNYELTNYELTNRYEAEEVIFIHKFNPKSTIGAVYFDGASKSYFVKRFQIETSTTDKKFNFISDHRASYLSLATIEPDAQIEINYIENGKNEVKIIDLDLLIDVKGWKAIGNRLQYDKIKKIKLLSSKKENDQEDAGKKEEKNQDKFDVGSQITLSTDKDDQLGLF